MTKENKLKVLNQTVIFYLIAAASTGSIYLLGSENPKESIWKLIVMNVVMLVGSFFFAYFGYKTAIKKGQIKD